MKLILLSIFLLLSSPLLAQFEAKNGEVFQKRKVVLEELENQLAQAKAELNAQKEIVNQKQLAVDVIREQIEQFKIIKNRIPIIDEEIYESK